MTHTTRCVLARTQCVGSQTQQVRCRFPPLLLLFIVRLIMVISVSFLKRRTQVSIPCSIQFSSAGTAPQAAAAISILNVIRKTFQFFYTFQCK